MKMKLFPALVIGIAFLAIVFPFTKTGASTEISTESFVEETPAETQVDVKGVVEAPITVNPYEELESALYAALNNYRAAYGLPAFTIDSQLRTVADIRAAELPINWSHTRPDGTMGYSLIPGNVWKGENLAYAVSAGQTQEEIATGIMNGWMSSPTHLDNIVFTQFSRVALSTYVVVNADGTCSYYVACEFAGK